MASASVELQAAFDQVWPANPPTASSPPHLRIEQLRWGARPACERPFWLLLSGMFRTFGEHASNTRRFLDASSQCWMVVLYTSDELESMTSNSQLRAAADRRSSSALPAAADDDGRSVAERLAEATRRHLMPGSTKGDAPVASVIAHRSHSFPRGVPPQRQVIQNWAAVLLFGRAVAAHHRLPRHASDVVLLSRPDVLFNRPVAFVQLQRAAYRAPQARLLLLMRGRAPPANSSGGSGAGGGSDDDEARDEEEVMEEVRDNVPRHNDPTDVALFASHAAIDQICPAGGECVGGRHLSEVYGAGGAAAGRAHSGDACGHLWAALLVHTAQRLGVASFFMNVGFGVQLHRLQGDRSWKANGGHALSRPDAPLPSTPLDVTAGARCAFGQNQRNKSACGAEAGTWAAPPKSAAAAFRLDGAARLRSDFGYGARMFVCDQTANLNGKKEPKGEHRRKAPAGAHAGAPAPATLARPKHRERKPASPASATPVSTSSSPPPPAPHPAVTVAETMTTVDTQALTFFATLSIAYVAVVMTVHRYGKSV